MCSTALPQPETGLARNVQRRTISTVRPLEWSLGNHIPGGVTFDVVNHTVEEGNEALRPGVDYAGFPQDWQKVHGALQRALRCHLEVPEPQVDILAGVGPPASFGGKVARYRNDRSLTGVLEHIVQGCCRGRQGLGDFPRADPQLSANAVGKAQEIPRKQHPGVSAGREDACLGRHPGDFRERVAAYLAQRVRDGTQGQCKVGARVAVGYREHVDPIQFGPLATHMGRTGKESATKTVPIEIGDPHPGPGRLRGRRLRLARSDL